MMKSLRLGFLSGCIRVVCSAVLLLQPLMLQVYANMELDEQNYIAVFHERLSDSEWQSLAHPQTKPWQFINKGTLDLTYQELERLTQLGTIYNSGTIICEVSEDLLSLSLPFLNNSGTIQFYGEGKVNERTLHFSSWVNSGTISFFNHPCRINVGVLDAWKLSVDQALHNTGLIKSDTNLSVVHKNGTDMVLGGIIEGRNLHLCGFDAIQAVLVSGLDILWKENRGDVLIEPSRLVEANQFDWGGIVYARNQVVLKFEKESTLPITAQIAAYMSAAGFEANIKTNTPSSVYFNQDHTSGADVLLELSEKIKGLEAYMFQLGLRVFDESSYLGALGMKINFQGVAGNLLVDGDWQSQGAIRFSNASLLHLGKQSSLESDRAILLGYENAIPVLHTYGRLKAPLIHMQAKTWKGRGVLDGTRVVLEAVNGGNEGGKSRSVHLDRVGFGNGLRELILCSSGSVQLGANLSSCTSLHLVNVKASIIGVLEPIQAQGDIFLDARNSLRMAASVFSKGNILLKGNMLWAESCQTLECKRIVMNHTGDGGVWEIPTTVRCGADDSMSLLAEKTAYFNVQGCLCAPILHIYAPRVHVHREPKARSLFIKAEKRLQVDTQITGLNEFVVQGQGYIYHRDINTQHLGLQGFYIASRDSILSMVENSTINVNELSYDRLSIQTEESPLTMGGGAHRLTDIDASQARIKQENTSALWDGHSHVGYLETSHHTTVADGAQLHVKERVDISKDQQSINIAGTLTTPQKDLHFRGKEVVVRHLECTDESGFDSVEMDGDEGNISSDLHGKEIRLNFSQRLKLESSILAGFLDLMSPDMEIRDSELNASIMTLRANMALLANTKIKGGHHYFSVSDTLLTSCARADVDVLDIEARKADLGGLQVNNAKKLDVEAEEGILNPEQIQANQARIAFGKYYGGLRGAIRLAHDLVNCDTVRIEALCEDLIVDQATQWRSNMTLAVHSAKINAPLGTAEGHLGLETQGDMDVSSSIVAESLALISHEGNIRFYDALLQATHDRLSVKALQGDVVLQATQTESKGDTEIEAFNIFAESIKRRSGGGANYADYKVSTSMHADGNLYVKAANNIHQKSITTHSGGDTRLQAGGQIIDEALVLERQSYSEHKRGYTREYHLYNDPSRHVAGGAYTAVAGGNQELFAPHIRAKRITLIAGQNVHVHDNHDVHTYESADRKKGGWLGSSRTVHTQGGSVRSAGAQMFSVDPEIIEAHKGNICLTNVNIQAPRTVLKAMNGIVEILQGRNSDWFSRSTQSSDALWQKQRVEQSQSSTFSAPQFGGDVEIWSKHTDIEQVRGKTLDFLNRMQLHGGSISYSWLTEMHEHNVQETSALAAPAAMVIGLAVSIATSGMGSGFGLSVAAAAGQTATATTINAAGLAVTSTTLSTAGAFISGMTQAAFASLCTQSVIAGVNSKGDLGQAAQSLTSSHSFNSLLLSSITGGLTHGLARYLDIDLSAGQKVFTDHLQAQSLQAGVGMGVNVAAGSQANEALETCLRSIAAGTAGACLANQIGAAYHPDSVAPIDPVTHKLLHAALGGMTGSILSRNPEQGAIAGAMGAFISETLADAFKPENPCGQFIEKVEEAQRTKGSPLTEREALAVYMSEVSSYKGRVQCVQEWSKLTAATAALISGRDVSVSIHTASNAVDNNFVLMAYYGVVAAGVAYSAYEVYQAYDAGGPVAALKQLGVEVACVAAGGAALRVGGKVCYKVGGMVYPSLKTAVNAALDRVPGLRIAMGGLTEKLIKLQEGVAFSTVGQAVARSEARLVELEYKCAEKLGLRKVSASSSVNYDKIVARIPGRVWVEATAMNPGVLESKLARTFSGGRYATVVLDEPLVVYRAWAMGGRSKEFGPFWSLEKPVGSIQACIDSGLRPQWAIIEGSPFRPQAIHYSAIRIPMGKKIHAGEVSSQGGVWIGGKSQIFIEKIDPAWKIEEGVLR